MGIGTGISEVLRVFGEILAGDDKEEVEEEELEKVTEEIKEGETRGEAKETNGPG